MPRSRIGAAFALDASSVAGQAQIQVLIAAYQQHRRIYVGGQGTCSIWGDTETATYIQVEDGYPSSGRYSRSGHISSTFLSSADNEAFRVTLDTPMTECAYNFAYVNSSASNYNAYVANLMSAYYAGKAVSLFYGVDASGFCEIIEYSVN